jgi:hypothetical protein
MLCFSVCLSIKFIDNSHMAKENKLSLDEIFAKLAEVESLKQQAIDQLLAERKAIDERLAKLGYVGSVDKPKEIKRRHRRTKAEIEASRAVGQS